MFTIKKLNKIADVIDDVLEKDLFLVSDDAADYDAALVRSADMHEMQLPESLLAIGRAGAGTNNIPVAACSEQGIVVFNTPGANANAVKELALCGMLLACRKVVDGIEWVKEENALGATGIDKLAEKAKSRFVGPELAGKKLGVIGLGAIGVLVANAACNGLGMEVVGYDPFMSVEAAWHLTRAVKKAASLEEIFSTCDFITLHVPLNDKTRGTVNAERIALMKDGAVVLNFARGGLVDDEAMLAALESGKISRYVTDFPNDTLANKPGVVVIPHLGASTPESEDNCARMAAEELRDYLLNGNIRNSVNLPDCDMPRSAASRVCIINRNVKNMLGQISSVVAEHGLNIDHMLNKSRGDWAYTILDLSEVPNDACVAQLNAIDGVVRVRVL